MFSEIKSIKEKVIRSVQRDYQPNDYVDLGHMFICRICEDLTLSEFELLKELERERGSEYLHRLIIRWVVSTGRYRTEGDGCISLAA